MAMAEQDDKFASNYSQMNVYKEGIIIQHSKSDIMASKSDKINNTKLLLNQYCSSLLLNEENLNINNKSFNLCNNLDNSFNCQDLINHEDIPDLEELVTLIVDINCCSKSTARRALINNKGCIICAIFGLLVELIIDQTNCSKSVARKALIDSKGDLVFAIIKITL